WGLGLVRAFAGEYDEATRLLEAAVALAGREQDHWAECECLQRLAVIELERGDAAQARTRAQAFAGVAARMGEGSEAPFAATLEALARLALGHAGADAGVERAIGALRGVDAKALLACALLFAAEPATAGGDRSGPLAGAGEALGAAGVGGRRSEIAPAPAVLPRTARLQGDAAPAQRYLAMAAADLGAPHAVAAHARRAVSAVG